MRVSPASRRASISGRLRYDDRTCDERDIGSSLEDLVAFLLGHAADDGEALAFTLKLFVLVQAMKDLLLRFVADGAGVVEDQAGVGFVCFDLSCSLR